MTPEDSPKPQVLIVGCGSIGGVLAIHLVKALADITIVTTNSEVRDVWTTSGPFLNNKKGSAPLDTRQVVGSPLETKKTFDIVFVAVQPPQIEEVAQSLVGKIAEEGRIVCLSNGLCEQRLGSALGDSLIVGAVVTWGARMPRPGHYNQTSHGGFQLGNLNGGTDPWLDTIGELLGTVGPVQQTKNLRGARFSKLAVNCAVSTLGTIGGSTLGRLLIRRPIRELGLSLIREAIEVAHADGVKLEAISKVRLERLVRLSPTHRPLPLAAQHALLLAVGSRYRNLRSSMLAAIERGRSPAVDFINGEVVALGKKLGMSTPYNEAATEVVWTIARGEIQPGNEALQLLKARAAELQRP